MVAANPERVGRGRSPNSHACFVGSNQKAGFNEQGLNAVVCTISSETQALLEIVNYNVEGEQYVCAGTVGNITVHILFFCMLTTAVADAKSSHTLSSTESPGKEPRGRTPRGVSDPRRRFVLQQATRLHCRLHRRNPKASQAD